MRILPALLALALLAPSAAAAPEPAYPPEFLALLPRWVEASEALATEADRAQPWWPEAEGFLVKAKAAQEAGRLRVAMFHLETFRELVVAHQLDDASVAAGSAAERRTFIAARTSAMREDADAAWADFRAQLHQYDGQLRSLGSVEKALYAADVAITAALGGREYDGIAQEFPKQSGVPIGYTLGLVRATHTMETNVGWARDMLAVAVEDEGLPPRVLDEPWANLTAAALTPLAGEPPSYIAGLESIGAPARENGEALMAIAVALAEQRAGRAYSMHTIFGDAGTRGLDVVTDAARGMNKQLANTTVETPRSYGLTGVFTSDAVDRADFTNEFLDIEKADLGTVIVAWSSLEHQGYVLNALSSVSPVKPEPREEETPGVGVLLLLAAGAASALAFRRR